MGRATVCVLEYEPNHGDLQDAVRKMVSSAKGGGQKFRTYRPTSGNSNMAVLVCPHGGGGATAAAGGSLEQSLGGASDAVSLLQKARGGVKSLRNRDVNLGGHSGDPAPFLVVMAGEYDLSKRDACRAAGQKILDAASKSNLKISVVTGDAADNRFAVVVSADSQSAIDDLNKPRPEIAGLLQEFHGLTKNLELVTLRYDGDLSNP